MQEIEAPKKHGAKRISRHKTSLSDTDIVTTPCMNLHGMIGIDNKKVEEKKGSEDTQEKIAWSFILFYAQIEKLYLF